MKKILGKVLNSTLISTATVDKTKRKTKTQVAKNANLNVLFAILIGAFLGGGGITIVFNINLMQKTNEMQQQIKDYEVQIAIINQKLNNISIKDEHPITSVQSLSGTIINNYNGTSQIMEPRQDEVTTATPATRIKYSDLPGSDKAFPTKFNAATNSSTPKKDMFELRDFYADRGQYIESIICSEWLVVNEKDMDLYVKRLNDLMYYSKKLRSESRERFKNILPLGVVYKLNDDVPLHTTDDSNDPSIYMIRVSIE